MKQTKAYIQRIASQVSILEHFLERTNSLSQGHTGEREREREFLWVWYQRKSHGMRQVLNL